MHEIGATRSESILATRPIMDLVRRARLAVVALSALAPSPTWAHIGDSSVNGFLHPFGGLDHLLAISIVGVLAGSSERKRTGLSLALLFLGAMAVGGVAGIGTLMPLVELAVAGSVLVLGLLLMLPRRPNLLVIAVLVAATALAHGWAHGAELPVGAEPAAYAAGFLTATALLLACGAVAGRVIGFVGQRCVRLVRLAGLAIAGSGIMLVAGTA